MKRLVSATALLIGSVLVGGCSTAQIAVPGHVAASTEPVMITGIGGWQDGQFQIGDAAGSFRRRAGQSRSFDTLVENSGRSSFSVSGPDFGGTATAHCGFDEREIDFGGLAIPAGRLTYSCRFLSDGRPVEGGLFIAEVPRGTGLLAGRSRAGEIRLGSARLGIQAIHDFAGGGMPAGQPIGYAFDIDGRQVGAVDINGSPKTVYAPVQRGEEREAVLLASLALATFWDPGE